jgi:MFS family permease
MNLNSAEVQTTRWMWPVLVLTVCHAEAIASFQVLNVLVEPIKAALKITDTQYSLMQGLAVAVFASLLGIPAAIVADRGNRLRVLMVGTVIWSAGAFVCGIAQNFDQLFAARMLVGVGEVFLFPAALSMIADVAPPNRLSSAIGIFGCGGPIGTAVALIGGGWLAHHPPLVAGALWWLHGEMWRIAFLMCTAFGALAVGLLFTMSEPRHRGSADGIQKSFWATVLHLGQHWKLFGGVSGGMLALSFCVFATSSWSPTMLVRVHGMSYAHAGEITGFAALLGGVAGTWAVGYVTDKIEASGRRDAPLQVAIAVSALLFLTIVAAVVIHSTGYAAIFLCISYSLLGMPTVLGGTALQQISPPEIRAQVMAIQVLLVNLLALSLGPLVVASLVDYVFRRPASVGYALAWTDGGGALVAVVAFLACRHRFFEDRRRAVVASTTPAWRAACEAPGQGAPQPVVK